MNLKKTVKQVIKPAYNAQKKIRYTLEGFLADRHIYLTGEEKKIASYQRKHQGERVFLVGTGPSLKAEDLELVQGELSIGCNMVYKMFDKTKWRPDYYCMTDRVYAAHQSQDIVQHINVPFFVPKSSAKFMPDKGSTTIKVNDIYDYNKYKVQGKFQYYCYLKASVMMFMLELAIYLGMTEIYLLGVDCTNTYKKNGHFASDYVTTRTRQVERKRMERDLNKDKMTEEELWNHNYQRNIQAYQEIKRFADAKGIKIYNATRGGELEVFPRISLEEALGKSGETKGSTE